VSTDGHVAIAEQHVHETQKLAPAVFVGGLDPEVTQPLDGIEHAALLSAFLVAR